MGDFNLTPQQPANGLTVLELFCGGGLGAIGFKAAGYDIVKALDFDKNAVKAYRHNFGDHVEQADISEVDIDSLPDTDVIFGGPPCQDFSVAGKGAGADGERGKLVWRYLEIIAAKQPKAFVFENVKGLITKRHRPTFDALIEKFNEIGYEISWEVVNAWHYGVAQKRERVFIVGVRKDLGFTFEFPKPLEGDYQTKVLRDVIGDLPEPEHQDCGKYWAPKNEYTYDQANRVQSMDKPSNTIPAHHNSGQPIHPEGPRYANHLTKALSDTEYAIAEKVPPGGDFKDAPDELLPDHLRFLKNSKRSERNGGQGFAFKRYELSDVSHTVTSDVTQKRTLKLHPKANRRFTVRECLRIQSAPDTYVLPDDISLSAQYRIVGNGIASRVAWYVGRALADQLSSN
ncbi:DNA cytosine methyltransferase [Bacillus licheniformis]|uniref:DNA cytosine methyltransferase n=1 Tax=Bacillus licheniformis TaxID=1402 RepID=UPI0018DA6441|nr:DNA cytosine methyltransferase [Bacillus licheniformis]QPI23287.1 DNA (cytosine-5-)-methyltransferase [Bacillus licheniformis]